MATKQALKDAFEAGAQAQGRFDFEHWYASIYAPIRMTPELTINHNPDKGEWGVANPTKCVHDYEMRGAFPTCANCGAVKLVRRHRLGD